MAQREVGEIDRARSEWNPNLQFRVEGALREDLVARKGVPEWCGTRLAPDRDTSSAIAR